MLELIRASLSSQFGAALAMLLGGLNGADGATWLAPVGSRPFWHTAYHVLFLTDLYLSRDEHSFRPRPFHRENYELLSTPVWAPERKVTADEPYDAATLTGYVDALRAKAREAIAAETESTLAGPSGFDWLPFPRLEAYLYNLRHLQHHTGPLVATLRRQTGKGTPWVVTPPPSA